METVETVKALKKRVRAAKRNGQTVGFVPTMGFLHEGHLSLMRQARQETDVVVASIFVNPTQFGPNEDFEAYPRDMVKDAAMTAAAGVDYLFTPSVKEIYPNDFVTYVEVEGEITRKLCGRARSGHFKGVTTVVAKLFNIVAPDFAYFGKKDAQQVVVIDKMVRDLSMDVDIVPCPIIRDNDGLALSSRNTYLTPDLRKEATILSRSLFDVEKLIHKGERNALATQEYLVERINTAKNAEVEYVEVVDGRTLENIDRMSGDILIALAVKFGKTRLIDNLGMEL